MLGEVVPPDVGARVPDAGHTVREYVSAVWRRKGLVLLVALLGVAAGWWQGQRSPDVYVVSTLIDIQKPKPIYATGQPQTFGESYHESQLYYPTKWALLGSRTYVDRLFSAVDGRAGRRFPVWDWLTWPVYLAERPRATRKDSLGPPIMDVADFEALVGIPVEEFRRRFSFRRYGLHPLPDAAFDTPADLAGFLAGRVVARPEKGTFLVNIELDGEERLALAPLLNLLLDVFWREQRSETQRRLDRERVFWGRRRVELAGAVPPGDVEALEGDVDAGGPGALPLLTVATNRLDDWKRAHGSDARRLEQRTATGAEQRRRGESQLRELSDQLSAAEPDLAALAVGGTRAAQQARLAAFDERRALALEAAAGYPPAEREALAARLAAERAELERTGRTPVGSSTSVAGAIEIAADAAWREQLVAAEAEAVEALGVDALGSRFHDLPFVTADSEVTAVRRTIQSLEQSRAAQDRVRREQMTPVVRGLVLRRVRELRSLLAQRIAVRERILRDDEDVLEQGRLADELADLQREHDRVAAELKRVDTELDRIRSQIQVEDDARPLRVIDAARDPVRPAKPNRPLLLGLGGAVGLLLGLSLALVLDWLDDTVGDPDDVVRHVGAPVLGSILTLPSRTADRVSSEQPRSPVTEAFRAIRTSLEFGAPGDGAQGRILLVSSCSPKEGKTTVASNLALVLAQDGKKTLLVDADLRRPRVHEVMGVDGSRGLTDVAVGRLRADDAIVQTAHENLWVLPAGTLPPNPAELLGRASTRTFLDGLKGSFDRVVIDTAPVGVVTDAAVVARHADSVVLVVATDRTKRRTAEHGAALLKAVGAPLTGVVMNMVERSHRWAHSGYYDRKAKAYYGSDRG